MGYNACDLCLRNYNDCNCNIPTDTGECLDCIVANKRIKELEDAIGYYLSIPMDTEDSISALAKLSIIYHKGGEKSNESL